MPAQVAILKATGPSRPDKGFSGRSIRLPGPRAGMKPEAIHALAAFLPNPISRILFFARRRMGKRVQPAKNPAMFILLVNR
jgi:hypothetical protein